MMRTSFLGMSLMGLSGCSYNSFARSPLYVDVGAYAWISVMLFGLAEMRNPDCNNSAGNWCAADDRLDFGPIHDEAHSMLLSSTVTAKPEAMSFFCDRLATRV